MIPEKSLVVYKNRPALVSGRDGEKIIITVLSGEDFKVREKDVELLHPGPCVLKELEVPVSRDLVREAWELLAADSGEFSLKELAELAYGEYSPRAAWAACELLREGLYFTGDIKAVRARPAAAVEEDEKKREEKQRESGDRSAFLERLKKVSRNDSLPGEAAPPLSETDRRFLQDVEALALGKTDKSRTMKELGRGETPAEAHRFLLASGAWTIWLNPHPSRFGLVRESAKTLPPPPPGEERVDLAGLPAYAIDSPWSDDPDDAVSLEGSDGDGNFCLWVHVADPAASVLPECPADVEARGRGATLYLPEGASRMITPEALPLFALGLAETSPALSIKLALCPDLTIGAVEIFPSLVRVSRLSYREADALISGEVDGPGAAVLAALEALMKRNTERRLDTGAVMIELPEVHIGVRLEGENSVSVEPVPEYRSAAMVRECMLLAGEGAARWALKRQLPFPYISQEAGELPARRLSGYAGAWQLRRCMRPRSLSGKPGVHWGLGLDEYTQVTSPLRRYTDLLCHQQIRAFLGGGNYRGREPLGEEEVLFRAAAAETAASAASRAERASRAHWMGVYLSDKKDSLWEAVLLDRRGARGTLLIPALGMETQVNLEGDGEPNDGVTLRLLSVKIPEGEAVFTRA